MKRRKMSRGASRKLFTRTASRTHKANRTTGRPKRGGIRW